MNVSRRSLLLGAAGLGAAHKAYAGRGLRGLKIGITDWNLNKTGDVGSIALARSLQFEGVQVSLGMKAENNKLPMDNPELQAKFIEESDRQKLPIDGTCLDILHRNYLKDDKLARKWVADSIPITKALKAKVILLPFFGKAALMTTEEMDYTADLLKELAPEAEKQGVIFGLENTISAENNVRMIDRTGSKAVQVYYDVGNSTNGGFDVKREIEWLGARRICQFHFKDEPHYLGEGKINFTGVLETISRIGYQGFANLETSAPSKSIEGDLRRNLAYIRRLIGEVQQS